MPESLTFAVEELSQSVLDVTKQLSANLSTMCYKPESSALQHLAQTCFTDELITSRSIHKTFAFLPNQSKHLSTILQRGLKEYVDDKTPKAPGRAHHNGVSSSAKPLMGKSGSVRSMPPQSSIPERLAMTPENIKPLLENAKEVHSRLTECIAAIRALLPVPSPASS